MSLHRERSETDVSPLKKAMGCAVAAETAKETTSSLHPLAASEINREAKGRRGHAEALKMLHVKERTKPSAAPSHM